MLPGGDPVTALTGRIGGNTATADTVQLGRDLAVAHAIIHILLTREHDGEAVILAAELDAARGRWITAAPSGPDLIVRAR